MHSIWDFIEERLKQSNPVMLIVVAGVRGSSPGKVGFKMAIDKQGTKTGSIGGGPMEYSLEKFAVESLEASSPVAFTKKMIHSQDAGEHASGLICAGEQQHVFAKMLPEDIDTVKMIKNALGNGVSGHLTITARGLQFAVTQEQDSSLPAIGQQEELLYEEVLSPEPVLYIFGGGHVSIPVSQMGRILGFRVEVYDDRKGLETLESNKWAQVRDVIDYGDAASRIKSPESSYVCIMTVSHSSDQQVLEQMLPLPLKYLGMIGSKNKVRTIFSNLREEGASNASLERVDSPMGIKINSETPAEIAVSILAEVIRRKNKP